MQAEHIPTFQSVEAAADRLRGHAVLTPLLVNDDLNRRTGKQVFLKAEPFQRTGSFKFRGAYNRLSQLTDEERTAGVVAFSSGNHAQGVAYAAQLLGLPAVIVMPHDAPAIKRENTEAFGADVIGYDRATESREEIAGRIAAERGATLVPAFDDPHIIAGQGTVGLEAITQMQDLGAQPDGMIICCGGGGLTAGCALAAEALAPKMKLFTAEPVDFDDTARSLAAGERLGVEPGGASFCDALLSPLPGEITFAINKDRVELGLTVTDAEVARAVSYAFQYLKVVLEPGGAVSLAAALSGKLADDLSCVCLILSGGNVDHGVFQQCLADWPNP